MAGWIAWLQRRPRGDRRLDVLLALQTFHLRRAWLEHEQDPQDFMPQWPEVARATEPENEAEELLSEFGTTQLPASSHSV
jgi:hypothetical protein